MGFGSMFGSMDRMAGRIPYPVSTLDGGLKMGNIAQQVTNLRSSAGIMAQQQSRGFKVLGQLAGMQANAGSIGIAAGLGTAYAGYGMGVYQGTQNGVGGTVAGVTGLNRYALGGSVASLGVMGGLGALRGKFKF